jgi:acetyl-CoA carboxylase biotin carboxyl carrier protein
VDKEIKELIDFISHSNFVEFELEREGFKIKLVKADSRAAAPAPAAAAPVPVPHPGAVASVAPPAPVAVPAPAAAAKSALHEVKSPLVGTFYRSPSPEAAPFTEVGRTVKSGQVLCIVEAMKLMNEIDSEFEGELVKVYVDNGQPVQYGERLFAIKAKSDV